MSLESNSVDISAIVRYIKDKTGLIIGEEKLYLLETRMKRLLERYECSSYLQLAKKAKNDRTRKITDDIIDAITIKETMFFRDTTPFDFLAERVLPDLAAESQAHYRPKPIRILSAACSTGQEAYSIAMVVRETLPELLWDAVEIVGVDISHESINRATQGEYNNSEITRGLSNERMKHFTSLNGSRWRVSDRLKSMVSFKVHNLLEPMVSSGMFDVVFCRNVAIYFDEQDRQMLFNNIGRMLKSTGYLILGSSESLMSVETAFESKRYGRVLYYQKKNGS